jgi:hypothetical protein
MFSSRPILPSFPPLRSVAHSPFFLPSGPTIRFIPALPDIPSCLPLPAEVIVSDGVPRLLLFRYAVFLFASHKFLALPSSPRASTDTMAVAAFPIPNPASDTAASSSSPGTLDLHATPIPPALAPRVMKERDTSATRVIVRRTGCSVRCFSSLVRTSRSRSPCPPLPPSRASFVTRAFGSSRS